MVDIVQIDHVEEGLSQLPSQWENSPNVRGLLQSWLTPLNTFEANLIGVRDGFNVNTAIGSQLDIIGVAFGINRLGRSDTDYRNAILVIIASGNGSGTPDQMINLFGSVSNTADIKYWEHYPLSMAMLATGGDESGASDASYMSGAKAACIEFSAIMYDPYGYDWLPAEASVQGTQIVDNLNNDLVDDLGNLIVANAIVEGVDDGTRRYSFVDQINDGELAFGYGVNYGGNYGGSQEMYSWLAEASILDNALVTSGGFGFVTWAGTAELDATTGSTNKAKPITQMSNSGLKSGQPMPRQFFNWLMANIDSWFQHIHNRNGIGTVRLTTDNTAATNVPAAEASYGSRFKKVDGTNTTWIYLGTEAYAGITTYAFKRTA